jgi:hypothetical protein
MRPEDAIRLRHMVEAAEATQRFIAGRKRADLDTIGEVGLRAFDRAWTETKAEVLTVAISSAAYNRVGKMRYG